jgi:hypothetical protein
MYRYVSLHWLVLILNSGAELMPDFFLEGVDTIHSSQYGIMRSGGAPAQPAAAQSEAPSSSGAAAGGEGGEILGIFDKIKGLMDPEMVKKTNAVFQFDVKGKIWFLKLICLHTR